MESVSTALFPVSFFKDVFKIAEEWVLDEIPDEDDTNVTIFAKLRCAEEIIQLFTHPLIADTTHTEDGNRITSLLAMDGEGMSHPVAFTVRRNEDRYSYIPLFQLILRAVPGQKVTIMTDLAIWILTALGQTGIPDGDKLLIHKGCEWHAARQWQISNGTHKSHLTSDQFYEMCQNAYSWDEHILRLEKKKDSEAQELADFLKPHRKTMTATPDAIRRKVVTNQRIETYHAAIKGYSKKDADTVNVLLGIIHYRRNQTDKARVIINSYRDNPTVTYFFRENFDLVRVKRLYLKFPNIDDTIESGDEGIPTLEQLEFGVRHVHSMWKASTMVQFVDVIKLLEETHGVEPDDQRMRIARAKLPKNKK